jgi:hypothetical protein
MLNVRSVTICVHIRAFKLGTYDILRCLHPVVFPLGSPEVFQLVAQVKD